jgi:hypothetical protein
MLAYSVLGAVCTLVLPADFVQLHPVMPKTTGNALRQTLIFSIVGAMPLILDVVFMLPLSFLMSVWLLSFPHASGDYSPGAFPAAFV